MGARIVTLLACLAVAQTATERTLPARFDAVVRSMMPEWTLQPVVSHSRSDPREEVLRWQRPRSQSSPGLLVTVRTYDAPDIAERALQKIPASLSTGAVETQGIGDHAYFARVAGTDLPWSGTVYARIDARLMTVSGDEGGADLRALATALAAELRKANR